MPALRRHEVVQGLLSLFDQPRYLEIGVSRGVTFHAAKCPHKVAVDPRFRFDVDIARAENPGCVYHAVTSDTYFGEIIDPAERFDVIYLDGLHTLEQTLRDCVNALSFLSPLGIILIDDVRPSSYIASLPEISAFQALRKALNVESREWMGDVYRLVFFIDTFFQQLSFRTITDNHGQLVLWRQRRSHVDERRVEEIGRLPFESVVIDESALRLTSYASILDELRKRTRQDEAAD